MDTLRVLKTIEWTAWILLACVLCVSFTWAIIKIVQFTVYKVNEYEEKRQREITALRYHNIVLANSKLLRNIRVLNSKTKYSVIGINGVITSVFSVKSKVNFDRINESNALSEYLTNNLSEAEYWIQKVEMNRHTQKKYASQFNLLTSEISQQECNDLDIPLADFLRIERTLAQSERIRIPLSITINFCVEYTSPKGKNKYSKQFILSESALISGISSCKEREAYLQSEAYARKRERAKLTASLRYDILCRDGFKCRYCGRSPDDCIELEVDHIIPISKGGETTYDNLQTLCRDCNRGKGAKY